MLTTLTPLTQSFSTGWGGDFTPRGRLAMFADFFGCHNWRGTATYWYVMGRNQACCYISCNAQDASTRTHARTHAHTPSTPHPPLCFVFFP